MGILNTREINTMPGNGCNPFTPPQGWVGDVSDYAKLMRHRYKHDLMHSQRMELIGWCACWNPVECTGPFAQEAHRIIKALAERGRKPQTETA